MRTHVSGGSTYFVRVARQEGSAGVEGKALVFTDQRTGAVLTVRVPADTDLEWMTRSELDNHLSRAR